MTETVELLEPTVTAVVSDEVRNAAFEKFHNRVEPIARAFVYQYHLPEHNLDDLIQQGSLGLLRAASLKGERLDLKYANKAIKTNIWRATKKVLKHSGYSPQTGTEVVEFDEESDADTSLRQTPRYELNLEPIRVREALAKLEPQERKVVELALIQGFSEREVATRLGLNQSRVWRIKTKAKEKLKNLLGN